MVRYPELSLRPYPERSRFSRLFSTWRRIITASILAISALLFVVSILYSKVEVHIRRINIVKNPVGRSSLYHFYPSHNNPTSKTHHSSSTRQNRPPLPSPPQIRNRHRALQRVPLRAKRNPNIDQRSLPNQSPRPHRHNLLQKRCLLR